MKNNPTQIIEPTFGVLITLNESPNMPFKTASGLRASTFTLSSAGSDSGNLNIAITKDTVERSEAAKQGNKYGWTSKIVSTNMSQR